VKIVWAPLAIERASEEAAFIAADKPGAAERWLSGLFKAVDRLATFPLSGARLRELPNSEYRQLVHKSHRVVYRVSGETVIILTVRRFKHQLNADELT
jgi:plasmid stabilization system protein ParE